MKLSAIVLSAALFAATRPSPAAGQMLAGTEIVDRMHKAYDGKWYKTLTFVQKTIVTRANGQTDTTTWYETLSGPARLRIDTGDPSAGNGVLYTADSSINMRNGAVSRRTGNGNVFLPLIMGVYLQPVATTEKQLRAFHFEMAKMYSGALYKGQKVTIVGATEASDSLSPQFWVDSRNLVVRVRGSLFGPGYSDIDLGGYQKLGDAWLATRVTIQTGQKQVEEYSDWKFNVPLDEGLFDPARWKTAKHWVRQGP